MTNNPENNTRKTFGVNVQFFITGFGPFHGVTINPTTILIKKLNDYIQAKSIKNIQTQILETSVSCVRLELNQYFQQIKLSIEQKSNRNQANYVAIHLGVAYNSKHIRLEKCAYNEASFRVPDMQGFQPHNACIIDGPTSTSNYGKCIETQLNVNDILNDLNQKNEQYNDSLTISTDPGRFVCNYTYYYSLSNASSIMSSALNQTQGNDINIDVLFVHVPPFTEMHEDLQFQFLLALIDSI